MNNSEMVFEDALNHLKKLYRGWNEQNNSKIQSSVSLSSNDRRALEVVFKKLVQQPAHIEKMNEDEIAIYFELQVIELVIAPRDKQFEIFMKIEEELLSIIQIDSIKTRKAGGKIVGCLLLSLDDVPSITNRILSLLGSFTDRSEGIKPDFTQQHAYQLPPDTILDLSKLLDYALFSEVFTFMSGLPTLQEAIVLPGLSDFSASLVSIASRKGGVGKSSIALAITLMALKQELNCRVCIIDLDITGPIWQYILCPDGRTLNGVPVNYLNRLIEIEQPHTDFQFGEPDTKSVTDCIAKARFPFFTQPVGLLTFRDLPRTNRYIVQAIANNRSSFTKFFVAILRVLSNEYDLIVIDNTPGFDPHPLISIAIAGSVPKGLPIVISTEQAPDLRGTFLELSDLRLLSLSRPPLWIVNKASMTAEVFFSEPHTLVEIADMTRGYSEIMPEAPILKQLLGRHKPSKLAQPIPFDEYLARPSGNNHDFANPLTMEIIQKFMSTNFFKRFEKVFTDRLSLNM